MLKGIFSRAYSRLFIVGDNTGWSTDIDAIDLKNFALKNGYRADISRKMYLNLPQAVHYTSQFSLLLDNIYKSKNRLSVDYYHGKPEQGENFKKCFEALSKHHKEFGRVRVSTKAMEEVVKSTGIDPEKVMRIPIGIDTDIFKQRTAEDRDEIRNKLNIPLNAVVIGSFQKDGSGWGEGLEPKHVKGPDIFLKVIEKLKVDFPNLFVLLSGPSRGYVKRGLDELGVPYHHEYLKNFYDITSLYDALDLYIITSREEGGPKACLESMAKGVPLVTTKVGQCVDLVTDGQNAMMTDIDAVESLAELSTEVLRDNGLRETIVRGGLETASRNNFESQLPLWKTYLEKLID